MQELANEGNSTTAKEWRCDCGRLLFKGEFMLGIIEVKCPRCKRLVYLQEQDVFAVSQDSFIALADPLSGLVLSATSGVSRVLGYSPEELNGTKVKELASDDFKPLVDFWLEKVASFDKSKDNKIVASLEALDKSGNKVEVSILAKLIGLSDRPLILCLVEKGYEQVDHFSERFAGNKLDEDMDYQYHTWDFLIDEKGIIKFVSPKNILGLGEDRVGESIFEVLKGDSKMEKEIMQGLSKESNFVRDFNALDVDGEEVSLSVAFRAKEDNMTSPDLCGVVLLKK